MALWPIAPFPQKVLMRGYQEEVAEGHIRTEMEFGPAKMRTRTDRNPTKFKGVLSLTSTQTQDLDNFYQDTLFWGTMAFEWVHQRTGSTGEFRFTKAPRYSTNGLDYLAAIEWEQIST